MSDGKTSSKFRVISGGLSDAWLSKAMARDGFDDCQIAVALEIDSLCAGSASVWSWTAIGDCFARLQRPAVVEALARPWRSPAYVADRLAGYGGSTAFAHLIATILADAAGARRTAVQLGEALGRLAARQAFAAAYGGSA
ncbi:MAG: hypothetical protein ACHQAY_07045 [Hyphomicrobiales bacterium]